MHRKSIGGRELIVPLTSTHEHIKYIKYHTHADGNKRQRMPMGQSKMNNPEKLTTQVTQDEETLSKNTTQYVLDTTIRKQTQIT